MPTDPRLASLQKLFDEREQLRRQRFSPAEQEQLFAEDRLMEQWTLRRKALAEADDADRAALGEELALWLAEQPQWFREAEANSRLLGDLQAYQVQLCRETDEDVSETTAAQLWLREVALPGMDRAHNAVANTGTAIQAYCDLLEVRWLLSERAGHDVGTERALEALGRNVVPADSAAELVVVETPTEPFEVVFDEDEED